MGKGKGKLDAGARVNLGGEAVDQVHEESADMLVILDGPAKGQLCRVGEEREGGWQTPSANHQGAVSGSGRTVASSTTPPPYPPYTHTHTDTTTTTTNRRGHAPAAGRRADRAMLSAC